MRLDLRMNDGNVIHFYFSHVTRTPSCSLAAPRSVPSPPVSPRASLPFTGNTNGPSFVEDGVISPADLYNVATLATADELAMNSWRTSDTKSA
jgi:hypothetical protein